ncbi:putative pentatricopeptide repeat-containing protein At3g11460, mitochondrial [Carica papaya]|uniref:putative pentatricopeptide repeat-containing protein At3g11460, mitochondrial n=1 Tax=Carica papaya TaxID=3649 RepID=UPI000B8CAF38|nr:putative pentatricopeptide repeat-containing protein At3g11460, mitochondrial [Carica papaya]
MTSQKQRLRASATKTTTTIRSKTPPWNTRLRELANQCLFTQALSLFRQMLRSGSAPNGFTFPFVLKSCASLSLRFAGAAWLTMQNEENGFVG